MKTHRVVVLLSEEELAEVKNQAGNVPLSVWFRSLALPVALHSMEYHQSDPMPEFKNLQRSSKPLARELPEVVKGKTCAHGTKRGWNCWMCGGVAKVE